MRISNLKMQKIEETLEDFKTLLPRYNKIKGDKEALKRFCSRNRNPVWDLTNIKYFKTGLKSDALIKSGEKPVNEHYVQRSLCMELIFRTLDRNPDMTTEQFIELLRKYASTISVTKDEHRTITQFTKHTEILNYMIYRKLGIRVRGLRRVINDTPKIYI